MEDSLGNKLPTNYAIGDRIELHHATDAWMSGDRYGQITKRGTKFYHVNMDRSGRIRRVAPRNILRSV
jgi:hypothetical protein